MPVSSSWVAWISACHFLNCQSFDQLWIFPVRLAIFKYRHYNPKLSKLPLCCRHAYSFWICSWNSAHLVESLTLLFLPPYCSTSLSKYSALWKFQSFALEPLYFEKILWRRWFVWWFVCLVIWLVLSLALVSSTCCCILSQNQNYQQEQKRINLYLSIKPLIQSLQDAGKSLIVCPKQQNCLAHSRRLLAMEKIAQTDTDQKSELQVPSKPKPVSLILFMLGVRFLADAQ